MIRGIPQVECANRSAAHVLLNVEEGEHPLIGLQVIYLARHGETAWSISGQHTGLTDLPLTSRGECNARKLGERLKGLEFARVLTSPLQRAKRTCDLAGFGS